MSTDLQNITQDLNLVNGGDCSRSRAAAGYTRPKTRGELRDRLKAGEECEVVASNADTTCTLLQVLEFYQDKDYGVRLSENRGWAVFFPYNTEPTRSRGADS
jgi:hypothetical protein